MRAPFRLDWPHAALILSLGTAGQEFRSWGSSPAVRTIFADDFERGLERWIVSDPRHIRLVASGSADHGQVLELVPNGAPVRALMRDSPQWNRVAIEGDLLFPSDGHSYLGFIWGFEERGGRADYASAYVKGNGSYLVANPHWDDNPARELYPENFAQLSGANRIRIGEWIRFRAELVDGVMQLYIGRTDVPQLVFKSPDGTAGRVGFRPRVAGQRVWIDNIRVRRIDGHSSPIEDAPSARDHRLLTAWEYVGPAAAADRSLELGLGHDAPGLPWRPFAADRRGAVITGRLVDYLGSRTVAYFRSTIESPASRRALLRLASLDGGALWLNGEFLGHVDRVETAWFSIASDSSRPHVDIPLRLKAGRNTVLVRIRGGRYAGGGFYAALLD